MLRVVVVLVLIVSRESVASVFRRIGGPIVFHGM